MDQFNHLEKDLTMNSRIDFRLRRIQFQIQGRKERFYLRNFCLSSPTYEQVKDTQSPRKRNKQAKNKSKSKVATTPSLGEMSSPPIQEELTIKTSSKSKSNKVCLVKQIQTFVFLLGNGFHFIKLNNQDENSHSWTQNTKPLPK